MDLPGPDGPIEAAVHEPPHSRGIASRSWIVLHGVTCPGEEHPSLVRFAQALAWSGGRVIIPEIQAWKRLELDPAPAQIAVDAALRFVSEEPLGGGADRPVAVVGFSFGCPQGVLAAARPEARGAIDGVVGFGGYADLEATVAFGLTGAYLADGEPRRIRPDPYGRWVVASNYLHRISGLEEATDVSSCLRELAVLASRRKIMSWHPVYDGAKAEMEARVAPERRSLFRLFAPPADQEPDPERAAEIAPRLATAARETHPALDALHTVKGPLPPIHLFHGRHDHLIPWAETLGLARRLEGRAPIHVTVTGLFGHSRERGRPFGAPAEMARFFLALKRVFGIGSGEAGARRGASET